VAILESAFGGNMGCRLVLERRGLRLDSLLFGESAGRIVVSVAPEGEDSLAKLAQVHRVPLTRLGVTGGQALRLQVDGEPLLDLDAAGLRAIHETALERALA
jgi:phosphoribosylformylglycinamidine synthase